MHTLLSASLLFYFSSYGYHLDLHSFPTRRSSDLFVVAGGGSPRTPETRTRSGPACSSRIEQAGPEDRKSTRLNSSHLGISYAVFCLKKKKTKRKHSGGKL